MRVLVEPAVFAYGRCGMTRYYAAVCEGLARAGCQVEIPLVSSGCDLQRPLTRLTAPLRRSYWLARGLDRLSARWFRKKVAAGEFDCVLVTSPEFDGSFLEVRPETRFVMVVHDTMSCVTAPDGLYDSVGPALMRLLHLAQRARRVLCISASTRESLLWHGVLSPEALVVVPTGNLLAAAGVQARPIDLPPRFLLFVGERSGRKGFYLLVRALQTLFAAMPDLHLVCTGQLTLAERNYIARFLDLQRVSSIVADDALLIYLYKNAACLAYPSLYEGYGLPVLEAMHLGCPVITTHEGGLAEVVQDAALIVPAGDLEALRTALGRLLSDPVLASDLAGRGRLQAERFSTQSMIESIADVLRRVSAD